MGYEYQFERDSCWYAKTCDKYRKDEFCNPGCIRYMEMHYLMNNSGIPKNKQYPSTLIPTSVDIKAFKRLQEIRNNILRFVDGGGSLYIHSMNFGNGKTVWSLKLMQRYFDQVWPGNGFRVRGIFIHVPTFLIKIKESISQKDDDFNLLRSRLLTTDLVVWDDIASTKLSEFDHANLLTYIDQRLLSGLANVYTGNLTELRMKEALGNRLTSRIWNESVRVEFIGADRRNPNDFTTNHK